MTTCFHCYVLSLNSVHFFFRKKRFYLKSQIKCKNFKAQYFSTAQNAEPHNSKVTKYEDICFIFKLYFDEHQFNVKRKDKHSYKEDVFLSL